MESDVKPIAADAIAKSDRYDAAIAFFERHPEEVLPAWVDPLHSPCGEIFTFLSAKPHFSLTCGCPSSVASSMKGLDRSGSFKLDALIHSKFPELAVDILELEEGSPSDAQEFLLSHLGSFAAVQRLADKIWPGRFSDSDGFYGHSNAV